jgi:hypothetical protein
MGKIDVGVGQDFPVEDGKQPDNTAGSDDERCRRAREERGGAGRSEWRARKRAFREDVRASFHKHFGDHAFDMHHHGFGRVLIAVALVALAVAILPHVFLFVALVLAIVFYVAHRGGFYHYHHTIPHHDADL